MATLTAVISFISAHLQPIVVAILAIDAALIPLFPNAGLLKTIKNLLSGVATPPSS